MISFLILPMQRVTRLPLLTDTLCLKTQGHPERYKAASRALKAISKYCGDTEAWGQGTCPVSETPRRTRPTQRQAKRAGFS
ncbi:Hypothetical predicted protein [Marmota monax]|uniref:DH domain-containing protein n=1 Tax=Marmota monax TaxID=9995 RepID=A0A5E4AP83_MARMO|nr:Hypothetical predicted protein [Marmota monax]